MSKDIVVLTPNARRVTVHCTPDTIMLQVLEDVCTKHGLEAGDYDLKHHNKIIDLSTTIRFSNLPNKACLEMVEAGRQRKEFNVVIGLQLEDGERRTGEFPPNTSLLDVISSLAATELNDIEHPTILYMRQEILGVEALREKTLRQLGLMSGRAILRLLNRSGDEIRIQPHVTTVLKLNPQVKSDVNENISNLREGTSKEPEPEQCDEEQRNITTDPLKLIRQYKKQQSSNSQRFKENIINEEDESEETAHTKVEPNQNYAEHKEIKENDLIRDTSLLERRLNIEEEVIFLGAQKAIAFTPADSPEQVLEDLPDDFYELTIDEIRRLYRDLQSKRTDIENAPLMSATTRDGKVKQSSDEKLKIYNNVVVRIQFPDSIILQGVFQPTNTVEDVINFVKQYLRTPEQRFDIFTTTFKGSLEPKMSLNEAKFVPCVHLHFKWLESDNGQPCLKDDIYSNVTSSDAASILASKYRAPSRRKMDSKTETVEKAIASTSKSSKVPKWFKK